MDNGILFWRIAGGFLIANLIGWIYSRHGQPHRRPTARFEAACTADGSRHQPHGKLRQSVDLFQLETNTMMPALFIGAGLAGIIQVVCRGTSWSPWALPLVVGAGPDAAGLRGLDLFHC